MFTDKVVIQKIIPEYGVKLYQNYKLESMWSFDLYGRQTDDYVHKEIFPFQFDPNVSFHHNQAGNETQISYRENKDIWFSDDYGVPAGFLIGILFPKQYVPEVFKFKQKPFIPTHRGNASISPPGYVDIHLNHASQQAAITFLITQPTYFGFKCIAKYYEKDFPFPRKYAFSDELLGTLDIENHKQINITREDLENFKHIFNQKTDLEVIADQMNELLKVIKESPSSNELKLAKNKFSSTLVNVIGTTGSLTTILDSYSNSGIVNKIISKILTYLVL